ASDRSDGVRSSSRRKHRREHLAAPATFVRRATWFADARRLRIDRDIASRSVLGAILPLHDVRYHAGRIKPDGLMAVAHHVLSCGRVEARLVEPDGIEPTTSCLQSRRSPN